MHHVKVKVDDAIRQKMLLGFLKTLCERSDYISERQESITSYYLLRTLRSGPEPADELASPNPERNRMTHTSSKRGTKQ